MHSTDNQPEGWGLMRTGGSMFRVYSQHYFLRGVSLCGKRRDPPALLSREPIGAGQVVQLWPCCAKCRARSSTLRFRRKRESRHLSWPATLRVTAVQTVPVDVGDVGATCPQPAPARDSFLHGPPFELPPLPSRIADPPSDSL